MIRKVAPFALFLAAPLSAAGSQPQLNPLQETALQCSALFAIVAGEQARHTPGSAALPALGTRGREYFVLTSARLMDETGMGRDQVRDLMVARVRQTSQRLATSRDASAVMAAGLKPCLALLDAEVPVPGRRPR